MNYSNGLNVLVWAARRAHAFGIRGIGRGLRYLAQKMRVLQMLPVPIIDGRTLYLDLRETMCWPYFFLGSIQYESGETRFLSSVLRAGDMAVDVGANVGWYATLFAALVGPRGKVVAFEPNRAAYRLLEASARAYPNLLAVESAVSNITGEATLHIPTVGEAWFARLGGLGPATPERGEACQLTTLDRYLQAETRAMVIKCDVEGFEREVLLGAAALLASPRPPLWVIEISQKNRFPQYDPAEIFRILQAGPGNYRFYSIDAVSGVLQPVNNQFDQHFNAAAVPAWLAHRVDGAKAGPTPVEAPIEERIMSGAGVP